jgi:hypothetical protein
MKSSKKKEGAPITVNILKTNGGKIEILHKNTKDKAAALLENTPLTDKTQPSPVLLGKMRGCPAPENAEQLYEATIFKVNNNSLENQSVNRSGKTKIPQVQAARDAFFD